MENKQDIPVIGVVQVLQMLKGGKTREEIRVHYGITKTDLIQLFKHKDLIGKKTIKVKAPTFTVVNDEAPIDVKEIEVEEVEEVIAPEKPATMEIVDDTTLKAEVTEKREEAKSSWV
tara:strand:+ start:6604 stop:6954 length:351 start_codon:yes stop_codon:yes gene_type:complete